MLWNLRNPAEWLLSALGVTSSNGTPRVNEESMLSSAAIWYAINTIAGDVGKMPLEPRRYSQDGTNAVDVVNNAYKLLRDEPNDYQTADVFKEQIQAHALSWGNGRAFIERVNGQPVALLPMRPDATETLLYKGEKWHITQPDADDPLYFYEELRSSLDRGALSSRLYAIPDRDVLHIMGYSTYGVVGKSVADVFRDIIGTDLSAQRYNKDQLNNGLASRLMLEAPPGAMQDEEEAAKFLEQFRENYERKQRGHVAGMLREGIKAVDVSRMSNVDAQFIEQRKFTRQDVMLIFGLQHIPGDNSSVSYNSLEQKQLAYLASCLSRWLTRWEMQCDMKMRTEIEKRTQSLFYKFNRGTWLQMDAQATAQVLNSYVASKIMNRNEARDKLDLNPVPGGDVFENPNIQVQKVEDDQVQKPNDSQIENVSRIVRNTAAHIAADVLFNRFRSTECDRILQATGNKNFVAWIERNYETWQQTYERQAEQIGVDAAMYIDDLLDRKQQLLTACECQPGELQQRVTDLVSKWREL